VRTVDKCNTRRLCLLCRVNVTSLEI